MALTYVVIGITALVSLAGLQNSAIQNKLLFNAYAVHHHKQWHRLLSHGLLHGDYIHLIINMMVLLSFGPVLEYYFKGFFNHGNLIFCFFYISAIVVSTLTTQHKYKNDPSYNAVGASGAISAIVFACILFAPTQKVYLFGMVGVPGYLFGPIYLYYSWYMDKKAIDNVGHDAHFVGAIYGLVFPLLVDPKIIFHFLDQF